MDEHQILGLVAAVLAIIAGVITITFSLGFIFAAVAGGTSLVVVGIPIAVAAKDDGAEVGGWVIGAFIGGVLLAGGLTYYITHDPRDAAVMMGDNGVVGIVVLIIGAAMKIGDFVNKRPRIPTRPTRLPYQIDCFVCSGTGKLLSGVDCPFCNGTGRRDFSRLL